MQCAAEWYCANYLNSLCYLSRHPLVIAARGIPDCQSRDRASRRRLGLPRPPGPSPPRPSAAPSCCAGMGRGVSLLSHLEDKDLDPLLRAAGILENLRRADKKRAPIYLNLDSVHITQEEVMGALLLEAKRIQGFLPPDAGSTALQHSPAIACGPCKRMPPPPSRGASAEPVP